MNAINLVDHYQCTKECIMLTENELHIPGIRLFAARKIQSALPPLPLHYHENAFEFSFIDKGTMSFFTSQKNYEVPGSSVFVSFPNEPHSSNNVPITLNEQYWFQLDIHDPSNFLYLNKPTALEYIRNLYQLKHMLKLPDVGQFRFIIKNAFELALQGGNRHLIAGYFTVLLQMLIESETMSAQIPADIENTIHYIQDHIFDELSLDFLAERCGLSTSHFKQKFRNTAGISPRSYINQYKIEQAKKMLLTENSITDIAMKLGFNTSSYFTAVFKKYTMHTPRDYIKNHRDIPE